MAGYRYITEITESTEDRVLTAENEEGEEINVGTQVRTVTTTRAIIVGLTAAEAASQTPTGTYTITSRRKAGRSALWEVEEEKKEYGSWD